MAKQVRGMVFRALTVWQSAQRLAQLIAVKALFQMQTTEPKPLDRRAQRWVNLSAVLFGAAGFASSVSAQTLQAAGTKINTELTSAATIVQTILITLAGFTFLCGLIMFVMKNRNWSYFALASIGSVIAIPIKNAIPGLAR
jgi:hypothetical protein